MDNNKRKATKTMTRKRAGKLTGEHIVIPDGYTVIGEKAFAYRKDIISVTLPDSLTEIGYGTFFGCSSLRNIPIPDGVTVIGEWAFHATALTSVAVPASVTEIGDHAFSSCDSLTEYLHYRNTHGRR